MRTPRFLLIITVCLLAFYVSPTSLTAQDENPTARLFAASNGYIGQYPGSINRPYGVMESFDGGSTWKSAAWPDIKASHVAPGPDGRYIYAAVGNGVLVSPNGGYSWKLTGGWEMTEVDQVAVDYRDSSVAWAATPYGVYKTGNAGDSWTNVTADQPFRLVDCIFIDRYWPDRIFIGTEYGLYIGDCETTSWEHTGPNVPVRSIFRDESGGKLWAGTDGAGLWASDDNGSTWAQVDGVPDVVHCIASDPSNPDRLFLGHRFGVSTSTDGGETWEFHSDGFTESSDSRYDDADSVYDLLVDRDNPERILAATRHGLFESPDSGASWNCISLETGLVIDLAYVEIPIFPMDNPDCISDEPGRLEFRPMQAGYDPLPGDDPGFDARASVVAAASGIPGNLNLLNSIAIIREGNASDELRDQLREYFSNPGHSMFFFIRTIAFFKHTREFLPDDLKELIRLSLVENPVYRGDTENHFLMYYTSLLLTTETWPESSASQWFNHQTSQYNHDEATAWIDQWIRTTSTIGQGEYDSPAYFPEYLLSLLLLRDFAFEWRMQSQAMMALDLLFADYLAESLDGRYCGGHSRITNQQVQLGDGSLMSGYYYLFIGGIEPPETFPSWVAPMAYTRYRVPEIIREIPTDRPDFYVHRETARKRNVIRYGDEMNPIVYKYDYMTPLYCLGSTMGGVLQPIQQHTWDVTWIGSSGGEYRNTTLFTVHPHFSSYETGMFFPEDPHSLVELVVTARTDYCDPDKWIAASPYERTFQHENSIISLYNIPDSDPHPFVNLYWPDCLTNPQTVTESAVYPDVLSPGIWIFGRDGDFYVGVFALVTTDEDFSELRETLHDGSTSNYLYLRIPAGIAAFIIDVGSLEEDGTFDDFKSSILGHDHPVLMIDPTSGPVVSHETRSGHEMVLDWGADQSDGDFPDQLGDRWLDGQMIDESQINAGLFDGPSIFSARGSGIIMIANEDGMRVLDFNRTFVYETEPPD